MSAGAAPARLRFAPSPTGSLHLGNARTALFNWLVARRSGGALVVRIEDTDTERHQAASEAAILDDLRWLGLDWDEGPDRGGPFGPYRQSERGEGYRAAAARLMRQGRAYPCFCDAGGDERAAASGYPGTCRTLAGAERERRRADPHAIRFAIQPLEGPAIPGISFRDRLRGELSVDAGEVSDPVILRRDGRPTYNFAAVVDDAAMEITLVLRGDDHLSNTYRQALMFDALDHPRPEFAHLPMVRGTDGSRLSKRHGAVALGEYRRRGYPREGLVNALALLGWAPGADETLIEPEALLERFELDRVGRAAAAFDPVRLDWLSAQHIQRMPAERLAREIAGPLVEAGLLPGGAFEDAADWLAEVGEMLRDKLERFGQVPDRAATLFSGGPCPDAAETTRLQAEPGAAAVVRALAAALMRAAPDGSESWGALRKRVQEESGQRGKALFHPLRWALTGSTAGPALDRLVPLIDEGHRRFPDRVPSLAARAERALACLP